MIKKLDYYVGAFVSFLLTHNITPALFEGSNDSKVVTFDTDNGAYNLYVKYCGKPKELKQKNKQYRKWSILFAEKELNSFLAYPQSEKKNLLVVICTDAEFKSTKVVVLTFEQALQCLGEDAINKTRNIHIKLAENAHKFECHGTGLNDKTPILVTTKYTSFFETELSAL